MPYLVGDSFGGVQQAATAEDQMRRLSFATSMANLLGSLRERNQVNYQNRALSLQQEFQNKHLELQRDEMNWRNQIQQEHNDILRQGTQQYGDFMKWQQQQPNAQTLKDQEYQEALAGRQAQAGYFNDAAHVKSVYPKFTDAQAGLIADESQRARRGMEADYQTAQDAAGTFNRQADLGNQIRSIQNAPKNSPLFKDVSWYQSVEPTRKLLLAPLQDEKSEVDQRAKNIQSDPRLRGLVSLQNGKYVPSVPAPSWTAGQGQGQTTLGTGTVTPEDQAGGVESPAGSTGTATTPQTTGAGTGGRKYSPMVYDRAQYWTQQGYDMPNALARALRDTQAVQGTQAPAGTAPEDLP